MQSKLVLPVWSPQGSSVCMADAKGTASSSAAGKKEEDKTSKHAYNLGKAVDKEVAGLAGGAPPRAEAKLESGTTKTPLEEKRRAIEEQEELEVEQEFEALMLKSQDSQEGGHGIAEDPVAKKKALGFRIVSMNMRDGISGSMIWNQDHFEERDMFTNEMVERVPRSILSCRVVSREIVFRSVEPLSNFRLEQRVYFRGSCIEQWLFTFGYVIPGSTNSWQQVIEAAPPDQMLPADQLSGNVTFESSFFDGSTFLGKNLVRIFYV